MIPVSVSQVLERIREIDARFGVRVQDVGGFSRALRLAAEDLTGAQQIRDLPAGERGLVERAARSSGVDPALAMAVLMNESGGNPTAVSPAGALGLMQLMPGTARELGVADPFDPEQNVRAGVRYLREKLDEFGSAPLALAAYNAGSAAVLRFGGIPPYPETMRFVDAVLRTRAELASGGASGADGAAPARGAPRAGPDARVGSGQGAFADRQPVPGRIDGRQHGGPEQTLAPARRHDGLDGVVWRGGEADASSRATEPGPPAREVAHRAEAPSVEAPRDAGSERQPTSGLIEGRVSPTSGGDAGAAAPEAPGGHGSGHDSGVAAGGRGTGDPGTRVEHGGHGLAASLAAAPSPPAGETRTSAPAAPRDRAAPAPERPAVVSGTGAVRVTVRAGDGDHQVGVTVVARAQDVVARVAVPTHELGHALAARADDLRTALASHRIRLADLVVAPATGDTGRERRNGFWYGRRAWRAGAEEGRA